MHNDKNIKEKRKEMLKKLLTDLQSEADFEEVKQKFKDNFENVSASEIADAERSLIADGGFTAQDITKLCDVHAALFDGSIESIHKNDNAPKQNEPLSVFIAENEALIKLIENEIKPNYLEIEKQNLNKIEILKTAFLKLEKISLHYIKKENIIFPVMEKHGITAPPKVMWSVDDEIRELIKQSNAKLKANKYNEETQKLIISTVEKIEEMISKEVNILIPMIKEAFTETDWEKIEKEILEEDYFLMAKPKNASVDLKSNENTKLENGVIKLPSGVLNIEQLVFLLNKLPIDITFVDKDDTVKYFSENEDRIFPRHRTIVGRNVSNCHPPKSVHIVEEILSDFKSGKKDSESFWIKMKGKYIYIRYFAVRNDNGEYLGTLEVSQDIMPLQIITGEKRLMS